MMKKAKLVKWIASVCFGMMLFVATLCLIGGGSLSRGTRESLLRADAAEVTVGELMVSDYATSVGQTVNEANFKQLIQRIANNNAATYDSLKASLVGTTTWKNQNNVSTTVPNNLTSRQINGNATLKVTFGGIVWVVTYVTTTGNDGNGDLIATLMTDTAQGTSRWNEGSVKVNEATSRSANYPYNMYSSSYVRVKVLNAGDPNGGATQYAPHTSTTYDALATVSSSDRASNKWAKFTLDNATGSLTKYIATPAQVRYQAVESWAYLDYVQVGTTSNCNLHNEAYETPTAKDNWLTDNYLNTKKTAAIKAADWKNDYLWLPSLTEVGSNNKGGGTKSGVWCTQNSVRSAVSQYLCRTGGSGSQYTDMLNLTSAGWDGADTSTNVRPALHLNLTKLYEGTKGCIPQDAEKEYTGSDLDLTKESWYKAAIHGNTALMSYTPKTVKAANEEGYDITFTLAAGKTWGDGTSDTTKTIKYKVTKKKASITWNTDGGGIPTAEFNGGIADDDKDNPPTFLYTYYKSDGTELSGEPSEVGDYKVSVRLDPASNGAGNYKLKDKETDADPFTIFTISKQTIVTPTVSGGKSATYTGNDIEFILQNVEGITNGKIVELTESDMPDGATYKKEADGTRKIIVKDVGTYKITFKLTDATQSEWGSGGGVLNLTVTARPITLTLNRESGSWQFEANTEERFTITHDGADGDEIEYDITYTKPDGEVVMVGSNMMKKEGKVTTVTLNNLGVGVHSLSVSLAASAVSNQNKNYNLSNPVTQAITVNGKTVVLDDSDIVWELTETTKQPLTENMTVTYSGKIFTAAIDTTVLAAKGLGVKAYTNQTGKNAGKYTTTVTITKLDETYLFEDKTFTIHWEITKAKYDLSNVKWDYSEPVEYTGSPITVKLTNVPNGLTATCADNKFAPVGVYYATVMNFTNSDSTNYVTPVSGNSDSYIYNGEGDGFPWTLEWHIKKAVINMNWDYTSATHTNNGVEFAYPTLIDGDKFVEYEYYEAVSLGGGSYGKGTKLNSIDDIVAVKGEAKSYIAEAVLKEDAKANYEMPDGDHFVRFVVGENKTPVTVKLTGEATGDVYDAGTYDGKAKNLDFTFSLDLTAQDLTKSDFALEYLDEKGNLLEGAPKDAGQYKVRIVLTGDAANDFYVYGKSTFNFEIKKQTIKVSEITWNYTDAFVYTRESGAAKVFEVKLNGLPDELVSLGALSYTGNNDSVVGTHTAYAALDPDGWNNYEFINAEGQPATDRLEWNLTWEIKKRELKAPTSPKTKETFDGKERNLIELCKLDDDWAEYLDITVKRDSKDYEGTTFTNAGTYSLLCAIKSELSNCVTWADGSILAKSGFVTMNPRKITVTGWQSKPAKPMFASETDAVLYEVVYTLDGGEGEEISEAEITDHYGEKIRATLRVPDSMAGNVTIGYGKDTKAYCDFILFDPSKPPRELEKPVLKEAQLEYTGKVQEFEIENFVSKYMTMSEPPKQERVGKYSIKISLKGDENVVWIVDGEDEDNTGTIVLEFEIIPAKISGTWGYDSVTKLPVLLVSDEVADLIEYVYYDRYDNEVSLRDMQEGVAYAARAVLKDEERAKNYTFAAGLLDDEVENSSKPFDFKYGEISENPGGGGDDPGHVDPPIENTNRLPVWQLIVGGISALLFVVCSAKAFGEYGKYKAAKKEAKELAQVSYAVTYGFAPLPLMAIEFLGLGETPWTIIAFVALGLFLASFAAMLVLSKKRKAAELVVKREQARIEEEKEYARQEEQQRRDNDFKMMFAAMQQNSQQPQMQYDDMRSLLAETVTALLPGLQQSMQALPPAQAPDQYAAPAQTPAPNQYGAPAQYAAPSPETDTLREQIAQQQAQMAQQQAQMAAQQAQMAQQQELINQLLQNQQAQAASVATPQYAAPAPAPAPAYDGYAAPAQEEAFWTAEGEEIVSLEELYGKMSDEAKRGYYEIGSYIMNKPQTSQNDGKYAVLFKYRGKTLFKLCIKNDVPVLYYPADNGGRAEILIVDATALGVAKSIVDVHVAKTDNEMA